MSVWAAGRNGRGASGLHEAHENAEDSAERGVAQPQYGRCGQRGGAEASFGRG